MPRLKKAEVVKEQEVRNKIVLEPGTEHERTIYLKRPTGLHARQMMPRVMAFLKQLNKLQNEPGNSVDSAAAFMDVMWAEPDFEATVLPFVLQMEGIEDRQYLNDHGSPIDIIEAFTKAAQWLMDESFGRPEVQAALKKSGNGTQEAATLE